MPSSTVVKSTLKVFGPIVKGITITYLMSRVTHMFLCISNRICVVHQSLLATSTLSPKSLCYTKKWHKKPILFLASMGETGLSHFLKFSLEPFEVVEVEWWSMLNFQAVFLKFCNCSWKFGSSSQRGKLDLFMTKFWFIRLCYISYFTVLL